MRLNHLDALLGEWRSRAELYRKWGNAEAAGPWDVAIAELSEALQRAGDQTLTLAEAAERTGYTADYLRVRIKRGDLHNAGRRYAPLVRVGDLPAPKPLRGPGRPVRVRQRPDADDVRQLPFKPNKDPNDVKATQSKRSRKSG